MMKHTRYYIFVAVLLAVAGIARGQHTLGNIPAGWTVTVNGDTVNVTNGEAFILPGAEVVVSPPQSTIGKVRRVTLAENYPLTFEAAEDDVQVRFVLASGVVGIQYSTGGSNWSNYTSGTVVTLTKAGDRVMFRGSNAAYATDSDTSRFIVSRDCYVYGNIMSLVSATNYGTETSVGANAFVALFASNESLRSHPVHALELPATTLSQSCYKEMFKGCSGLAKAPELPAETLAEECYSEMFYGCGSLRDVTCRATDISAPNATFRWLDGTAAVGTRTFNRNAALVWERSTTGVPFGWTIVPPQHPAGSVNAKFNVGTAESPKYVYFSQGNLQYIGSAATPYWKFADHQYDILGTSTQQNSDAASVDRDLFGWGTGDAPSKTSTAPDDYSGDVDWGTNSIAWGGTVALGWRALTKAEWNNLIANHKWGAAQILVSGAPVYGILLDPDVSAIPRINVSHSSWSDNVYPSAEAFSAAADTAGYVFLPLAGYRNGTGLYSVNGDGSYWFADSYINSFTNQRVGYYMHIDVTTPVTLNTYENQAYFGYSVRLVKDELLDRIVRLDTLAGDYVAQDGDILTDTLQGNHKISVVDGATVTLRNADISSLSTGSDYAGITCIGNATILLEEGTVNKVVGGVDGNNWGQYPGIYVPEGHTLVIDGAGMLTASCNLERGELGGGDGAAGIGGGLNTSCGHIRIHGGTITALGGEEAAGIGCGSAEEDDDEVTCGDITITGGNVTAVGGFNAAGIGSASAGPSNNTCGAINITGGTVNATGGLYGSGIGAGKGSGDDYWGYHYSICGPVTIANTVTVVTATKGEDSPYSIGPGMSSSQCGVITIGGEVKGNITVSPFVYYP